MKALDLSRLNKIAPYHIEASEDRGFYDFETAHGVQYSIGFLEDEELLPDEESCTLIIANINHRKSPNDYKVRDTIMALIEEFFNQNVYTLLYICETGDGKQMMRGRLFSSWFSSYKHHAQYTFMSTTIKDIDGIMNFAAMIIRNDNPRLSQVITKFSDTVQTLSEKPLY